MSMFPPESVPNGNRPPARSAEELLALIPQELAVNQGVARRVGEVTLVACRAFTSEDAERLATVTPREYTALLLASEALPRADIAAEMGISEDGIASNLNRVYRRLGVSSKDQAATFIPIDAEHLRPMPAYYPGSQPQPGQRSIQAILTPRELQVFDRIANGIILGTEISLSLPLVSAQTIDNHKKHIRKKLGLKTGVELARVAGALQTIARHRAARRPV